MEFLIAKHARLMVEHGCAVKVVAGRGRPFDRRIPVHTNPLFDSRHTDVLAVQRELARGAGVDTLRALAANVYDALAEDLADCDLCIAHNVISLHKNLALTVALKQVADEGRVRVVAWCHDLAWMDPLYLPELHEGWPWHLLRTPWPQVIYVTVSQARRAALAELLHLPASEVRVITSGIDPQEFLGIGPVAAKWADRFGWWRAEPLMLLPARVTRRKNIELGIEITAALKACGYSPALTVMGPLGAHNPSNAAYLQSLRDLSAARTVSDAVIFLQEHGRVGNAARRDLYLIADLLLFPSTQEGFGIPVLEGGLAKLPVFCSDIPPFRESGGNQAHYFRLDDKPEHIAVQIHEALANDWAYQLRRRVLREYDWQRIWSDKMEPLLHEAMR